MKEVKEKYARSKVNNIIWETINHGSGLATHKVGGEFYKRISTRIDLEIHSDISYPDKERHEIVIKIDNNFSKFLVLDSKLGEYFHMETLKVCYHSRITILRSRPFSHLNLARRRMKFLLDHFYTYTGAASNTGKNS